MSAVGGLAAGDGGTLASLPAAARIVGETPFRGRGGWLLLLAACGSLVAAFLLLVFRGESLDAVPVGADSYSRSALGHSVLARLLQSLGRPVVQSRQRFDERAQKDALLVIAEPLVDDGRDRQLAEMVQSARRVLVVLPKRRGEVDPDDREWIGHEEPVEDEQVAKVLDACGVRGGVVHPDQAVFESAAALPLPTIDAPQLLKATRGAGGRPLVDGREGVLVAAGGAGDRRLWILADPDPIANHGIVRGDNAAFAVALLDELRQGHAILIDETLHGWELEPSAFAQLGRFPLVLLLVQMFVLTAVVAWLAAGRFGSPLAAPPAIAPGKAFLVENIASLLAFAGHNGPSLRRFAQLRVQQAAARRHAPALPDHRATVQWLATGAGERGQRLLQWSLAIEQGKWRAVAGSAVQLAQDFERNLEEITHGRR